MSKKIKTKTNTKLGKKLMGKTRMDFPEADFKSFQNLFMIRGFINELCESTGMHKTIVYRMKDSGRGRKEHVNSIIKFSNKYKKDLLLKGMLVE